MATEHKPEVDSGHAPDAHGLPGHAEAMVEVHAGGDHGGGHGEHGGSPLDVSGEMFAWTLATFAVMAYVLAKLAWRPILNGLELREQGIRDSVEKAEKIEEEYKNIDEKRSDIISTADTKAKEIVDRARQAGREAERVIKDKAKEDSGILLANAEREIRTARDKASADLREESVELALSLAGKILEEKLDPEAHRELTDRLITKL